MKVRIAPSLMCSDFRNLESEVRLFERKGVELLHLDVMDGHFVTNITLGPPVVKAISAMTRLPLDIHMMVTAPEQYLPDLALPGSPLISVHVELGSKVECLLRAIRAQGGRPAVAISPQTPSAALAPLVRDTELILVMCVQPGNSGRSLVPGAIERIAQVRELAEQAGASPLIEADGNTTFDNIRKMAAAGADVIVAGTSCLYRKGVALEKSLDGLITFIASL